MIENAADERVSVKGGGKLILSHAGHDRHVADAGFQLAEHFKCRGEAEVVTEVDGFQVADRGGTVV